MGWDIIGKYSFLALAMIIVLYFVGKLVKKDNSGSKEGFTADSKPEAVGERMSDIIEQLKDELIIAQYRPDYESLIINADQWCSLSMLSILAAGNIGTAVYSKDSAADITAINKLSDFKNNLNGILTFLDSSDT